MERKILIVEDDPFIAMDLQDTFEVGGFDVLGPVANVEDGLAIIRNHDVDIAMLDFNLGRQTSVPLAEVLCELGVPYVFLSGQTENVLLEQIETASGVLTKPFNPSKIVRFVSELLSHSNDNT